MEQPSRIKRFFSSILSKISPRKDSVVSTAQKELNNSLLVPSIVKGKVDRAESMAAPQLITYDDYQRDCEDDSVGLLRLRLFPTALEEDEEVPMRIYRTQSYPVVQQ